MIWPILRDRRSRLVYGAYSSSPRAKGILRYSQMKEHGLAGCWGVGAGGLLGCWCCWIEEQGSFGGGTYSGKSR
jgi:hypothetical protein